MTNQIKSNQSVSFEVFILSLSSLNLLLRPNVLVLIVAADVALCGSSFMRWWLVRLWEFIISRLSHLGKIKKIFLHNQQAVHRTKTGLWQALWKRTNVIVENWGTDYLDEQKISLMLFLCHCCIKVRLTVIVLGQIVFSQLLPSAKKQKPALCSVSSQTEWVMVHIPASESVSPPAVTLSLNTSPSAFFLVLHELTTRCILLCSSVFVSSSVN